MRKTFTIFSLLLFAWLRGFAQPTAGPLAKDVLKSMPADVIPLLTHNNILDMIDFLKASCKAEVTNRMNGKSEMTVLNDCFTSIRITPSNTIDIKLLPLKSGGTLIYVVSTCKTDSLTDSSVKVYTDKWELADEGQQFRFPHPDSYNTMKLSATNNKAVIREIRKQLLFEGETSADKPDIVTEYECEWDTVHGNYIIKKKE